MNISLSQIPIGRGLWERAVFFMKRVTDWLPEFIGNTACRYHCREELVKTKLVAKIRATIGVAVSTMLTTLGTTMLTMVISTTTIG